MYEKPLKTRLKQRLVEFVALLYTHCLTPTVSNHLKTKVLDELTPLESEDVKMKVSSWRFNSDAAVVTAGSCRLGVLRSGLNMINK